MTVETQTDQIPLAIIGMACSLPGAPNLHEYWRLIHEGRSEIGELPEDRFERSLYYDPRKGVRGKSYASLGALASWPGCDLLPPSVIESSDPAHLTFCQVAAEACRHANLEVNSLDFNSAGEASPDSDFAYPNTGVYVGHTNGTLWGGELVHGILIEQTAEYLREVDDFHALGEDQQQHVIDAIVSRVRGESRRRQPNGGPFLSPNRVAALVSLALGLTGPGLAVNAACASSLIALSIAARALEQDQIEMAIIGGLSYCKSNSLVLFSKAQSVSATGSRPFDENADGLVVGEGCAALVIRRLDRAIADNNPIQAVIRGVGIASDGKGKSLWAPRKEGQIEAMRRAYGGDPDLSRLGYVEAHATSTQLGDATELEALSEVMQSRANQKVPIGSVKANIGHTLETAGVAGLVKTVLAMQHKTIPPAINVNRLNPKIDWPNAPLFVPTSPQSWPAPRDVQTGAALPRRAAVNSFGIGGLNGHVVLDEFPFEHERAGSQRIKIKSGVGKNVAEPIAVIGAAVILPGAANLDEFEQVLKSGADCKSEVPPERWDSKLGYAEQGPFTWHSAIKRGGFIKDYAYDWRKHKVPPKQVANADPTQFMLLDVVDQALIDSGYRHEDSIRNRTGVVIGNAFDGEFTTHLQMGLRLPGFRRMLFEQLRALNADESTITKIADRYEDVLLERMPALLDETGSYSSSTLASRITKTFNLMGGAYAIDSGQHSSFAALSACLDILRGGHCDLMICAAGQRSLDLPSFARLSASGIFDTNAQLLEEMLPGEGAGALLLKRLSDARRDGDRVRAVIHASGVSQGSDLRSVINQVAERGFQRSELNADDVIHLETTFADSSSIEPVVSESLAKVFSAGKHDRCNSVAHQIGDLSGAAGMASLITAILKSQTQSGSNHSSAKFSCFSCHRTSLGRKSQAFQVLASSGRDESTTQSALRETESDSFVLNLSGTPYEMGLEHGRCQSNAIQKILRRNADLSGWPIVENNQLDRIVEQPDLLFAKNQLDEMRGIADGAGVSCESIVAHNIRMAGDVSSGGCVHAAMNTTSAGMIHAANEDLPIGLSFRDCLARIVQVRQSPGLAKYVVFSVVGQVCGINGMNEHGLSVSSSMLLDRCHGNQRVTGRIHNVLVQNLLEAASDIPTALEIIGAFAPAAAGAWSLVLSDGKRSRTCYVEYDKDGQLKTSNDNASIVSANHSLLLHGTGEQPKHSCSRLARFSQLFSEAKLTADPVAKIQLALREQFDAVRGRATRHPTMNTIRRVDNQVSVVMRPDRGTVLFTAGSLAEDENRFFELQLSEKTLANQPDVPAGQDVLGEKDSDGKVCDRFVMRMAPARLNLASPVPFRLDSAAWILGNNEVAKTLRHRIELEGGQAVCLPVRDDPDEVLAELDLLWQQNPAGHLFLLTAFDEDSQTDLSDAAWQTRRSRGVVLPYLVTQRWHGLVESAGMSGSASVVAGTLSGGDFGFNGFRAHAESGAISGLIKGLNVESGARTQGQFRTKVVDFAPTVSPSEIVNALAVEMASGSADVEIGYPEADDRHLVQSFNEPLGQLANPTVRPTGNWIVTGGARGVTAAVAKRFADRFGVKLHLIGSSPLPEVDPDWRELDETGLVELRKQICQQAAVAVGQTAREGGAAVAQRPIEVWQRIEKAIEIDRNMHEMLAAGMETVYHACDVGDRTALARVLETIRQNDGSIDGIIHGAGFEKSCRFEKKTRQNVERTVRAKVDGAAALMALTRNDNLQAFLAFGSISGRIGALGQTDYCLANDMLAKLVGWYRGWRPDCPATVFHWPAWGEVGMAMRPETRGLLERFDLRFMPLQEGADYLINELLHGLPESEILIADAQSFRKRFPEPAQCVTAKTAISIAAPSLASLPLIDEIVEPASQGKLTVACHLNPTLDPFLLQHKYRGRPLLPIVISMEAMLQAASLLVPSGQQIAGLRNVEAVAGLMFHTDRVQKPKIRTQLTPEGIDCELVCDFHNRAGSLMRKDVLNIRGRVELAERRYSESPSELNLPAAWGEVIYPPEREEVLYHGPIFRNSKWIKIDPTGGWAKLTAPRLDELAGQRSTEGWLLSPGLIDSMLFSCGIYAWLYFERAVAIPQKIGRVRLGRPVRAEEECVQRFKMLDRQGDRVFYELKLYGENNDLIYSIEEYQSIIVTGKSSVK